MNRCIRHRYDFSMRWTPHFYCVRCDAVTFRPWWPRWKEAHR